MSVKTFLEKKNVKISAKVYFIDALGSMALGLFASLLIGTIFNTLGDKLGSEVLLEIADYCKKAAGPAMAVAIAYALKAPALVLFSCVAVGVAGNLLGGPVGVLVATIVGAEFGKVVSKETSGYYCNPNSDNCLRCADGDACRSIYQRIYDRLRRVHCHNH